MPEHYVFNGRAEKIAWMPAMKGNTLRAAERCVLSCCALCGPSETADKRQAAGAAPLEEDGGKCQQAAHTSRWWKGRLMAASSAAVDRRVMCYPSAISCSWFDLCLVENSDGTSV